ncbi:MAG: hypothetical protein EOP85_17955 [Verrucomicrobiaceae bacterium]|nr:MAG: hypothetical protein EOP85_17955 [Verrucomicrobiaceae bacterium]
MNVYLTKAYDWRRRHVPVVGTLLCLGSGAALALVVIPGLLKMDWKENPIFPNLLLVLFCAGIPAFFLWCGLWMLWRWMKRDKTVLEISNEGVRYGTRFDPWDRIRRISWRCVAKGGYTLFYQTRGFSFDRNLLVTAPLTEEEIMSLFRKLEMEVVPRHGDLKIVTHRQPDLR